MYYRSSGLLVLTGIRAPAYHILSAYVTTVVQVRMADVQSDFHYTSVTFV